MREKAFLFGYLWLACPVLFGAFWAAVCVPLPSPSLFFFFLMVFRGERERETPRRNQGIEDLGKGKKRERKDQGIE